MVSVSVNAIQYLLDDCYIHLPVGNFDYAFIISKALDATAYAMLQKEHLHTLGLNGWQVELWLRASSKHYDSLFCVYVKHATNLKVIRYGCN